MKVRVFAAAVLLIAATSLFADVPQQISYQGRLTSATNTPITGTKNLTFKIYSGAGAVLWNSGAVAVTCTDGLFSISLGIPPQPALPVTVFTDTAAALGITVESDPELSPRTRLTATPFSYTTLRAPDYLPLEGGTLTGETTWDLTTIDVRLQDFGTSTALSLTGPFGPSAQLSSDGNGNLNLYNSTGVLNAIVSASPVFGGSVLLRSSTGILTHMFQGEAGDESTVLPSDAVGAPEILDEPGIAAGSSPLGLPLYQDVMRDLATTTITTPANGYVVLIGQVGQLQLYGTSGQNFVAVQIDETSGGATMLENAVYFGAAVSPSSSPFLYGAFAQRVYYKPAGTHTFILEAAEIGNGAGAMAVAHMPKLTAMYFPSSYGSVMSVAPLGDAAEVQSHDLRDFELRAAKAEAEAQKAKLELLQAQMKEQIQPLTNKGLGEK